MKHYHTDVPRLGNVAVSRHAQDKALHLDVSDELLEDVLLHGKDTPDGMDVMWREKRGVRLVILLNPVPYSGAKLVKTLYRVQPSWRIR